MVGIYGNHPEDRYYEKLLDKYLDEEYPPDTDEDEPKENEYEEI